MSGAVLGLRLFAGATILLHMIGKLQTYNEIIATYPTLPPFGRNGLFGVVMAGEALLALMLILGRWVRFAAGLAAFGAACTLVREVVAGGAPVVSEKALFYQFGIYLFLAAAGGGYYSFDAARCAAGLRRQRMAAQPDKRI